MKHEIPPLPATDTSVAPLTGAWIETSTPALDVVRQARYGVNRGHDEVVDADLSGYFDTIPHTELMRSVSHRNIDGSTLHLIRKWLMMPLEETD